MQYFVFGLQVIVGKYLNIYWSVAAMISLSNQLKCYSIFVMIAFTNSYSSFVLCFCFIIREHNLALIIPSVDFVSLDLHVNSIILRDPWVTVHLLLPFLICQLHPILWVPPLVLLPHHPHHLSWGLNLHQDPARSLLHPECHHQWAHRLHQLAWLCQRLYRFLNQTPNHLLRVPVL